MKDRIFFVRTVYFQARTVYFTRTVYFQGPYILLFRTVYFTIYTLADHIFPIIGPYIFTEKTVYFKLWWPSIFMDCFFFAKRPYTILLITPSRLCSSFKILRVLTLLFRLWRKKVHLFLPKLFLVWTKSAKLLKLWLSHRVLFSMMIHLSRHSSKLISINSGRDPWTKHEAGLIESDVFD